MANVETDHPQGVFDLLNSRRCSIVEDMNLAAIGINAKRANAGDAFAHGFDYVGGHGASTRRYAEDCKRPLDVLNSRLNFPALLLERAVFRYALHSHRCNNTLEPLCLLWGKTLPVHCFKDIA